METQYPWLEADAGNLNIDAASKPPANEELPWTQRLLPFLKSSMPWLGLLVAVLVLSVLVRRADSGPAAAPENATIDIVAPLVPIGRGQSVLAEQLRLVPLARKDLTKPQLLQIVRDEDLTKLKGRVVARKNLPPGRPLFWADLEWKTDRGSAPLPQILYPSKD